MTRKEWHEEAHRRIDESVKNAIWLRKRAIHDVLPWNVARRWLVNFYRYIRAFRHE